MSTSQSFANDDGHSPEEIESAADETPAKFLPPEIDAQTEQLTAWDEAPSSSRKAAPKVLPEDEVSEVERLVDEGNDEADRDRRIAAADADFEP